MFKLAKKIAPLALALTLIGADSLPLYSLACKNAKILFADSHTITLNVYNWEDYIAEDDTSTDEIEDDIIQQFEEYCLEEYNQNVDVVYDTFDTNETMLAQLDLGRSYDLVCPSDYTIQKMIANDMLTPFDADSTPNYDKNVSPYIKSKIDNIEVNGQKGLVSSYARGYMWGTLAILYNDNFGLLNLKGISSKDMNEDLKDWKSLWDDKYQNLLAIKDSMRDSYAAGIFKTYDADFTKDGVSRYGLSSLKELYTKGEISEEEYNKEVTEIFNFSDDEAIEAVEEDLKELRDNAFGFEVDSGKVDMAQGNKFAINLAWSGDAAWAMDMADEYNESHIDEKTGEYEKGFTPTILRYCIPDTGANIWFDGWVMPKTIPEEKKIWAERFVDFLSAPENAAKNMEFIGYTPVIAGDAILDLVKSWYDIRYDEENETIDEEVLNDYTLVDNDELFSLSFDEDGNYNQEIADYCYQKDISYFFDGTLNEYTLADCLFYLSGDDRGRQFDTQYPDQAILPGLAVMADFGNQTPKIVRMWERVKNTNLPLWAYIMIVLAVVVIIVLVILHKVKVRAVKKRRRERRIEREKSLQKN